MPMVGFGTWDVRGKTGEKILLDAVRCGYRLFDTAEMYDNEEIVGSALKKSSVDREEFFITTKISHSCKDRQETMRSIDAALQRLQTDCVDLFLIHEPYRNAVVMYEALEEAYALGKAKAIGVSNFLPKPFETLSEHCGIQPMVNQIESHVYYPQLDRRDELESCGQKCRHGILHRRQKTVLP